MKQTSLSSHKSRQNLLHTPSKSTKNLNLQNQSDVYFCHYKNGMYMGGIKNFQKQGVGIAIYDDGTSAVTSYFNDFKHGHCVFYKQNCILSVEYNKNKVIQCAIKIPGFIFFMRYGKQTKPDGRSILFNFETREIFYVQYRKSNIVEKRSQKDSLILNAVFDSEDFEYLIGPQHSRALKFETEKNCNIGSQLVGNKLSIGFMKKGLLNGLGFKFLVSSLSLGDQNFNVSPMQRGYFCDGYLNGMGEKWFKNGNYYIGEFKDGQFEGNGVLKNQEKNNWVFGKFQKGSLIELVNYSHEGDEKKFNKVVSTMHERKNNWICKDIENQKSDQLMIQISKILACNLSQNIKNLKQRKEQVLRKIQSNFMEEDLDVGSMRYKAESQQGNRDSRIRIRDEDKVSINSKEKTPKKQKVNNEVIFDRSFSNNKSSRRDFQQANIESEKNHYLYPQNSKKNKNYGEEENIKSDRRTTVKNRIFQSFPNDSSEELPKFNYKK